MRFLVVGLGSMGKRRLRNLALLEAGELAGFDVRADRIEEVAQRQAVPVFDSFEAAVAKHRPDALVISTPPDLHVRYARFAIEHGLHFFSEASVTDDGLDALIESCRQRPDLVAAPSCTLRYHPSVRAIRDAVAGGEIGAPLLFTYQSGQWLPDWHPWEDYRTFYVSKPETGACREIVPFELSWLTWAFGRVAAITAMRGKVSSLEADIDDAYQLLLRFESGVMGHLLVDVVARAPVRSFRLCGAEGTLEWDGTARRLGIYDAGEKQWREIGETSEVQEEGYVYAEDMYIAEMDGFAAACRGERQWPYSLEEDRTVLGLLAAAERSSDSGREICFDTCSIT